MSVTVDEGQFLFSSRQTDKSPPESGSGSHERPNDLSCFHRDDNKPAHLTLVSWFIVFPQVFAWS